MNAQNLRLFSLCALFGRHEASVTNQFKPGKTKIHGIWKHAISKNWIESMEFEWTIFPGFTTLGLLAEIQKMMAELKCELEQFQFRTSFCLCSLTLYGELQEMNRIV